MRHESYGETAAGAKWQGEITTGEGGRGSARTTSENIYLLYGEKEIYHKFYVRIL